MKQTKIDVEVQTNLTGARRMGVDVEAMGSVLSILSNMYSDGNLAVVREYASNARDSHQEAGNTDPILITSPSYLNPILTVQDFGTGLSADEVLNVYAVYGTSTKRGNNDAIGHFGIGAKSAFTVGQQFVVTAVKDGEYTVALFALDEDGAPTVNVVSQRDTDEPNGVKVEIGVSDVDGVVNAIERLFATWQPGSVLVDGVEPTSIWTDVNELDEGIHMGWRDHAHTSDGWVVIMGGVSYSLPTSVVETLDYRQKTIVNNVRSSYAKVYLTVPIGGVDITPSREDLRVTPQTTATLNDMVERFHTALTPWITEQISGAPSMISAIIAADELHQKLPNRMLGSGPGPTWNGKPIPSNPIKTDAAWFHLSRRGYRGPLNARREREFEFGPSRTLRQIMFVTGVPERRVRTVQLAAKEYLSAHGQKDDAEYTTRVVALTKPNAFYDTGWFSLSDPALRTMDFDTFAQFKPKPVPGSSPRNAIRYEVVTAAGNDRLSVAEVNAHTGNIYYMTHYERPNFPPKSALMQDTLGTGLLIMLSSTQKVDPLLKRVPRATSLPVAVRKYADTVLASVVQADLDALDAQSFLNGIDHHIVTWLAGVEAEITHEGVLSALGLYHRATEAKQNQARIELINAAARTAHRDLTSLGTSGLRASEWNQVLNTLPLLNTYFERDWQRTPLGNQHAIQYINMVGQEL